MEILKMLYRDAVREIVRFQEELKDSYGYDLLKRVPTCPGLSMPEHFEGEELAAGIDALTACAPYSRESIPGSAQILISQAHGAWTPKLVAQMRKEMRDLAEETPTKWWLALSLLCSPEVVDWERFTYQTMVVKTMVENGQLRDTAARLMWTKMNRESKSQLEDYPDLDGIKGLGLDPGILQLPFSTVDGVMQAAYLAGHPVAGLMQHERFFLGTYHSSLFDGEPTGENTKKIAPNFVMYDSLASFLQDANRAMKTYL